MLGFYLRLVLIFCRHEISSFEALLPAFELEEDLTSL